MEVWVEKKGGMRDLIEFNTEGERSAAEEEEKP